jgi:hypothetical protein
MHKRLLWEIQNLVKNLPYNISIDFYPNSCIFLLTGTSIPYEDKYKIINDEYVSTIALIDPRNFPHDQIKVYGLLSKELYENKNNISTHYYNIRPKDEIIDIIKYFCKKYNNDYNDIVLYDYCVSFLAGISNTFDERYFRSKYEGFIGGVSILKTLELLVLFPGTSDSGSLASKDIIKKTYELACKFTNEKYKIISNLRKEYMMTKFITNNRLKDVFTYKISNYLTSHEIILLLEVKDEKGEGRCYHCKKLYNKKENNKYITLIQSKNIIVNINDISVGKEWLCKNCINSSDYQDLKIREEGTSNKVIGYLPFIYNKDEIKEGLKKIYNQKIENRLFKEDELIIIEIILHLLNETLISAVNNDRSFNAIYFYKYNNYINKLLINLIEKEDDIKIKLEKYIDVFIKKNEFKNLEKITICAMCDVKYNIQEICVAFIKSKLIKDKLDDRLEINYAENYIRVQLLKNFNKIRRLIRNTYDKDITDEEINNYQYNVSVKHANIYNIIKNSKINRNKIVYDRQSYYIRNILKNNNKIYDEIRSDYEKYCNIGLCFFIIRNKILREGENNPEEIHKYVNKLLKEGITLNEFIKKFNIDYELFNFKTNNYFEENKKNVNDINHLNKIIKRNNKNRNYEKNKKIRVLLDNLDISCYYTKNELINMLEYLVKINGNHESVKKFLNHFQQEIIEKDRGVYIKKKLLDGFYFLKKNV